MDLKKIRKKIQSDKKITIEQLSTAIDISKNSIYRIEAGSLISSVLYFKYLRFLAENNVDIAEILKENVHTKNNNI